MSENLREVRERTDREIADLLRARLALESRLAGERAERGEDAFDSSGEEQFVEELAGQMEDAFDREAVLGVLGQVTALARRKEMIREAGRFGVEHGFTAVPELSIQDAKVVYQGVEGAYSHQAACRFFGEGCEPYSVPTFEAAVAEIDSGAADYAVLPIENTTGGAVGDVLDLQMKYPCYTVAELDLVIDHVLLGLPGASLSEIRAVYSHSQGLAQCRDFLEMHKEWTRIPTSNTAASAKRVIAEGDPHHAAIASVKAGEMYGLEVLADHITNHTGNTTRFIIATRKKIYRKDARKIRICFECGHVTGALYRILSNFTFNSINMTKIESRPIPGRNWEYRFFVDFEGNLDETRVRNAIYGIRREASVCRILGNF